MLFTVAHELSHFIRQWSPAKFKVLANLVLQQYGEKNIPVRELIDKQIAKAKRHGRTIGFDEAYEEVVADSMEAILADGYVVQLMADMRAQDKTLWEKVRDWFKDLAQKLQAAVDAFRGVEPDSVEGKLVSEMQDMIVILESFYTDALMDAGENYAAGAQKNTAEGGGVKYSSGSRERSQITATMTDTQRTEILQTKSIVAPVYAGEADASIQSEEISLMSNKGSLVKAALIRIGEEFKVFTGYKIADVEIDIRLSRGNLKESVSKKIDPVQIAKLLPVLKLPWKTLLALSVMSIDITMIMTR